MEHYVFHAVEKPGIFSFVNYYLKYKDLSHILQSKNPRFFFILIIEVKSFKLV